MSFTWLFRHCQRCAAIFLLILFYFGGTSALSQDVEVNGGFLSDSLKIGEQTAYYLSARYPSTISILFPDSAHLFTPFDFVRKEYFQTETTDGISADSAVYYLTSFEVERVQYLDLPVYILQGQDCTLLRTSVDSVLITQFVQHVPDSLSADQLPLKMNTAYQKVFLNFNVWVVIIIALVFISVLILTWLIFGKRIKQYFVAKRLTKNHSEFARTYNSFLKTLQMAFSAGNTESALSVWKKYMEKLDARPYTKLTTRETLKLVNEPALSEHLGRIDQAIYGHNTVVLASLQQLKAFADQQYARKLKEVRRGK